MTSSLRGSTLLLLLSTCPVTFGGDAAAPYEWTNFGPGSAAGVQQIPPSVPPGLPDGSWALMQQQQQQLQASAPPAKQYGWASQAQPVADTAYAPGAMREADVEPHRQPDMPMAPQYQEAFNALQYQLQQQQQEMGQARQQFSPPMAQAPADFENSAFLQTYAQTNANIQQQPPPQALQQQAAPSAQDAAQILMQLQQQQLQGPQQGPLPPSELQQRIAQMETELGMTQQKSDQLRTENSQLRQELDRWRVTAEHVAQREALASKLLERPGVAQALQAVHQAQGADGKPVLPASDPSEANSLKLLTESAEVALVHSAEEFGKGHWGPPAVFQLAFFVFVGAIFLAVMAFRWFVEKKSDRT